MLRERGHELGTDLVAGPLTQHRRCVAGHQDYPLGITADGRGAVKQRFRKEQHRPGLRFDLMDQSAICLRGRDALLRWPRELMAPWNDGGATIVRPHVRQIGQGLHEQAVEVALLFPGAPAVARAVVEL